MQNTKNTTIVDKTKPDKKWAFDSDVAACFEDMLKRSIPQYDVMRQASFDIACKYVKPNTTILDLGCSRGEAMAPLIDKYGAQNRFVGVEVSKPMLEVCHAKFEGYIKTNIVDIKNLDLREAYPPVLSSVTLCILTLQFIPIEYRQRVVSNIYKYLGDNGALILVEKVLGNDASINDMMVDIYYKLKNKNGYSLEDIERKRLSLEGVLVPVTSKWNEELLRMAGFKYIDCFWRWMNFAGWVAIK